MEGEKDVIAENVKVESPTGRAAFLEAFRSANPDTEGDPDDEALWGFAHDRHSRMSGANERLSQRVADDPRAGVMLSMFADGKSLPYAMGQTYGRDWIDADPEEFEAGYQEHLKELATNKATMAEAAKNTEQYFSTLETYANDNGLDEAQMDQLHEAVATNAHNILMGIIPAEYIDLVWKGLNHDKDVDEAAETGFIEGKNTTIDMKKQKASAAPLPDLTGGSGAGKPRTAQKPSRRRDMFEDFKPV